MEDIVVKNFTTGEKYKQGVDYHIEGNFLYMHTVVPKKEKFYITRNYNH